MPIMVSQKTKRNYFVFMDELGLPVMITIKEYNEGRQRAREHMHLR